MKINITSILRKENIINILCSIALFIAINRLPIAYYTFLRILVFIGSLLILFNKEVIYYWKLIFIPIAVFFNPIAPIFLYLKSYWIPIDMIVAILFLFITFYGYEENNENGNKKGDEKKNQITKNKKMYHIKH